MKRECRPVGKENGPTSAPSFFPRGVESRRRRRLAPRCGNRLRAVLSEPHWRKRSRRRGPTSRAAARHVANCARGSAGSRTFFSPSVGEERERRAVRRPEWRERASVPEWPGIRRVEGRTKIWVPLKEAAADGDVAQKAILRPSGDSAKNEAVTEATTTRPVFGGGTSKRIAPGEDGFGARARSSRRAATADASDPRPSAPCPSVLGRGVVEVAVPEPLPRTHRARSDVTGGLPACLRIFRETLADDAIEQRRCERLAVADGSVRIGLQDRRDERLAWLLPANARAPSSSRRHPRRARTVVRAVRVLALRAAPAPCTERCRRWPPHRHGRLEGHEEIGSEPAGLLHRFASRSRAASLPAFVSIRSTASSRDARFPAGEPGRERRDLAGGTGGPGRAAARRGQARRQASRPRGNSITRESVRSSRPTSIGVQMCGCV